MDFSQGNTLQGHILHTLFHIFQGLKVSGLQLTAVMFTRNRGRCNHLCFFHNLRLAGKGREIYLISLVQFLVGTVCFVRSSIARPLIPQPVKRRAVNPTRSQRVTVDAYAMVSIDAESGYRCSDNQRSGKRCSAFWYNCIL